MISSSSDRHLRFFSLKKSPLAQITFRILSLSQSSDFEQAAAAVKAFTKRPTDEELLEVYGLYKQATAGDNETGKSFYN